MVTEISISENFLEEYLPRATIEILPPLPCDNFYLPDSGRHVTSVHQGLSQAGAGEEPGYEVECNIAMLVVGLSDIYECLVKILCKCPESILLEKQKIYKMKCILKNNVILKPKIWVKTRQNYNETVIFRLYFKVILFLLRKISEFPNRTSTHNLLIAGESGTLRNSDIFRSKNNSKNMNITIHRFILISTLHT